MNPVCATRLLGAPCKRLEQALTEGGLVVPSKTFCLKSLNETARPPYEGLERPPYQSFAAMCIGTAAMYACFSAVFAACRRRVDVHGHVGMHVGMYVGMRVGMSVHMLGACSNISLIWCL